MKLGYLKSLVRSLNSLFCEPLPLSKKWLNEIDRYLKEIVKEHKIQFPEKEFGKNCVREDFMCPFTEIAAECRYASRMDLSHCVECLRKVKEKEMSECEKEVVKMKCFHTNKNDRFFWSKDSVTKKYDVYKKYWGGIITNKPSRTKEKYAHRISIDGSRMSSINEEDFKKIFAPICEHIYEDKCNHQQEIKLTSEMCDNLIKGMLIDKFYMKKILYGLTPEECNTLFNELIENNKLHEIYTIRSVGFDSIDPKKDRLIILKKK